MTVFQVAAALYALFMLVRHAPAARRGRAVSILVCVLALAVVAVSARALLLAATRG
jgi:hypothetical protein